MRFILRAGISIPYTEVHINIYTHAQSYIHTCTLSIPHHLPTRSSPPPRISSPPTHSPFPPPRISIPYTEVHINIYSCTIIYTYMHPEYPSPPTHSPFPPPRHGTGAFDNHVIFLTNCILHQGSIRFHFL